MNLPLDCAKEELGPYGEVFEGSGALLCSSEGQRLGKAGS